ncbi:hypothetical protein ACKJSM_24790 [Pseudomonas sp. PHC1]|uniref:hypothetical protein n=1 Tax=Pseudomonas sp. PHC1 TaxID=3384759 RepID=UPI00396F4850
MSTQNPFFTYCTTYPGGSPIPSGSSTPSTGIELGGSGPPGTPYEIIHNGEYPPAAAVGTYNPSGAFIQQQLKLTPGPHRFELRVNASSSVTDVWTLTVRQPNAIEEDWQYERDQIFSINSPVRFSSGLTVRLLSQGWAINPTRILSGYEVPGIYRTFLLGSGSDCEFSWGASGYSVEFLSHGVSVPGNRVVFYNSASQPIGSLTLPTSGGAVGPQMTTFTAPDIRSFRVDAFKEPGGADTGFVIDQIRIRLN